MIKSLDILLADDAPSTGRIVFDESLTFIAGPNGSGKSRVVAWVGAKLRQLSSLPAGSRFQFETTDVQAHLRELLRDRGGDGPYDGEVDKAPLLQVVPEGGGGAVLYPDLHGDAPERGEIATADLDRKTQDYIEEEGRVRRNESPVIVLGNALQLPLHAIKGPRVKVLDAQRMQNLKNAFNRPADPRKAIEAGRNQSTPNDVFAILEADPSLEVELLSRIEALTGVRITVRKEGSKYQVSCSRPGREGEWNHAEEADGVISLLLLLPYLFSTEYDIVLLDEPEAHLYPGLQQTLRSLIYEACDKTGKQVLLATHSERIVAPPLTNFRDAIHVTVPHPKRPEVVQLRKAVSQLDEDSGQLHQWLSEQAFGDNQESVFSALFASETIVVEGQLDMIFLDRIARYVGPEFRAGSVALLEAGGKGGVAPLVRFLKAMGRLTKVVVDSDVSDQPGVLRKIASEMGDKEGVIEKVAGSDHTLADLQEAARKFDIYVLSHPGIEGYYRTLEDRGNPKKTKNKRTALIRELKSIEGCDPGEIRARYEELITILESAVRRMPEEWLQAHARDTNERLANLVLEWRRLLREGSSPDDLKRKLGRFLTRFGRADFTDDGSLRLQHRFLSAVPLEIQSEDDPVRAVEEWVKSFRSGGS